MRRPATKSKPAPNKASTVVKARSRFPVWLMAVLLVLVTIALYWPATGNDFVNYDDEHYVTDNTHVTSGLTLENARWALGSGSVSNWHPVTWLSHMLDCQLFGLNPWGHHLTSVLLHALNAALVFALLQQMTGAMWRSLIVAALFAVHPLRVESVGWIAERKDVLSGSFGLLSLIFYARYARKRSTTESRKSKPPEVTARDVQLSTLDYVIALFFLALGLMSKPILVTWPFVMLLLDYWPLRRLEFQTPNTQLSTIWRLVREKIPFFALAAVSGVVTFQVQKHGGAIASVENLPLGVRSGNALISYCRYLGKLFWPMDLAVFYPHPGYWPMEQVLLAGGLIGGISALLYLKRRRYPFLLMGWLWFIGTLVPVIGLVQVGWHAIADRYTYIPTIGIIVAIIWGLHRLANSEGYQRSALSVTGSVAIVLCMLLTREQLGHWKNSETLFRHTLKVTKDNWLAHYNLGCALDEKGQTDEAVNQFQETIRLRPDYMEGHNNLGKALSERGQISEAISQFQESIRLKHDYAEAYNNLGNALDKIDQTDVAIRQYREAIRLRPDYVDAYCNLGAALRKKGQMDEAIRQYQEAIQRKPAYAMAHYNLGTAFGEKGEMDQAICQFEEAIRLKPNYAEAHNNLGNALAGKGQTDEAIRQYREALRLNPDYPRAHNNLGVILEKKGQIDEAIRHYREAIRLKPDYADARNSLARLLREKNAPAGR